MSVRVNIKAVDLILFLASLIASPLCFAWCEGHPTVKHEFEASRYVFVAKVEKSTDFYGPRNFLDGTYYRLRVTENLKGYADLRIDLFSENTTAKFPMDVGKSYLVFVSRDRFDATQSLEYFVDSCGNSGSVQKQRGVLKIVRAIADPQEHFARFPPRLKEEQARSTAEKSARKQNYILEKYDVEEITYDDRSREWHLSGMGRDRIVGNHFLVIVDDRNGFAKVLRGY